VQHNFHYTSNVVMAQLNRLHTGEIVTRKMPLDVHFCKLDLHFISMQTLLDNELISLVI
jgi:hypothetical protein